MSQTSTEKTQNKGRHELKLTIEGKEYAWPEEYITGAQIKELAQISLHEEIFLSVQAPWKDELIPNEGRVNLARPEIEHFYVKKKLEYIINGERFQSEKQYVTGRQIRHQGGIPENHEIFLSIKGPWEDEAISDNAFVDLARPGIEHFYSKEVSITIIVNAREKVWKAKKISYEEVVELDYGNVVEISTKVYTVTYLRGPEQNPQGSMVKGDTVFIKNKMIFNVTATDKS